MSQISEKRKRTKTNRVKKEDKTLISKAQIGLLHVAKSELKLDDDIYRDMLENVAGVSSAVDLPRSKFDNVLSHLKASGFEIKRKEGTSSRKKHSEFDGRPGMATSAQLRYIELQFVQYLQLKGLPVDDRKAVDFGLRHYLKKFYKAEGIRFLTKTAASNAIEGLKNTLIHEREKQAMAVANGQQLSGGISSEGKEVNGLQESSQSQEKQGIGPGSAVKQGTVPGSAVKPGTGPGSAVKPGTGPGFAVKPGTGPNLRRVF